MACALGAIAGNAADGMQVFQRVQAEDAAAAERMIAAGQVRMELKEDVPRLWLRVTVTGSEGTGVAIVQDRHDNVAYLEMFSVTRAALRRRRTRRTMAHSAWRRSGSSARMRRWRGWRGQRKPCG